MHIHLKYVKILWAKTPFGLVKKHLTGALAKLKKVTISSVASVRPHGTTRLPPDGFSLNLTNDDFLKIVLKFKFD